MSKPFLRNFIILIPGITGSVLRSNQNQVIWGPLPEMGLTFLATLGDSLERLCLQDDDAGDISAPDGLRATELVQYSVVPGFSKLDGYGAIRRTLCGSFGLVVGRHDIDGPPANYFEFPYDWRRNNAASARSLKALVDRELPKWRARYSDARVVLIAHSMGGLLARYYLDVLGGAQDARVLVTLGTPHRGSLRALNFLVNGYRKLGLNLGALLGTFPSVYQLLPDYACIADEARAARCWKTPTEVCLPGLDSVRAAHALEFRRTLANAAGAGTQYQRVPVQGWGQSTLQSAVYDGRHLECSPALPAALGEAWADGDGTVPCISAIPWDLQDEPGRSWMLNQSHACLQNDAAFMQNLVRLLHLLESGALPPVRSVEVECRRGVSLEVDDLYVPEEPVRIRARPTTSQTDCALTASLHHLKGQSCFPPVPMQQDGDGWVTTFPRPEPGAYRVVVDQVNHFGGRAPRVMDMTIVQ